MRDEDDFAASSAPLTSNAPAAETSEEDSELTAHEYARECALCTDYLTENPWDLFRSWDPFETPAEDIENPEDGSRHEVTVDDLTRERLDIDLDARQLLFSIVKDEGDSFLHSLPDYERAPGNLRLEPPLLGAGDHELDVLHFGQRPVPNFAKMNLPMEHTEREKDQGMEWPAKYHDLPQRVERKYAAEKLEFPREGVEFLMGVMKDEWTVADMDDLYTSEMTYTKNKALEPLTPPLLPSSPPLIPFEPDPEAAELELLSESTVPGAAEAEAMNAQLTKLDRILAPGANDSDDVSFSNTDDLTNLYSPLLSVLASDTYSPPRKRKMSLKVEVPLTPQNPSSSSPAKKVKRVTFPEMLHEYVPDAPILDNMSQPMRNSDESVEAFFNDIIEPMALEATRALEQEQLQEADSLYRMKVPTADFTSPVPPWKVYSRKSNRKDAVGVTELDLQRGLLRDVKRDSLRNFPTWSGGSKIERQLPWSPFPPELGQVELETGISITADDRAAQYLQRIMDFMSLDDVVNSDNLTWKPDGLRILDDLDESEDELEEMEIEEPEANDMEGLLRKRRRELEEEQPAGEHGLVQRPFGRPLRSRNGPPTVIEEPWLNKAKNREEVSGTQLSIAVPRIEKLRAQSLDKSAQSMTIPSLPRESCGGATQPLSSNVGLFGTTFSAASALSNFMQKMGKASKKPETTVPKSAPAPKAPIPAAAPKAFSQLDSYTASAHPFPFPSVSDKPPSAFFILSSTLLQDKRSLVRSISKHLPSTNCVERDFATLPQANEADILISPATGLILTTIQKIKQKALPGQNAQLSGIRERLMKLSLRYERLIVLISEGAAEGGSGRSMDERDCEALSEFNGFAAGLDADVVVSFVPGGEEELVKWVVGCMVKYCLTHVRGEEVSLLQDETLWEQFLRRVGLNAFAAQLILADLKDTSDPDIQMGEASSSELNTSTLGRRDFGIRAFICMDPQERIQRFESLLGGRRVLGRVHRVLEQKWLSAADGFRQPAQL